MFKRREHPMKPTPIFVAAAGFAMIGACTVETEDNSAGNSDSSPAMTTSEGTAPAPVNEGETDTLGNQLNQLSESHSEAENSAE